MIGRAAAPLLSFSLVAAALVGCAAEMVELRPRKPGPVPEVVLDAGGGHLRYSLRGPRFLAASRRKDALEKMAEACGGAERFRIVDEVARQETSSSFIGGDVDQEGELGKSSRHYDTVTAQHVYFECLK